MSDQGTRFTDARQAALEKKIERIYKEAQKEILEKLKKHERKKTAMMRVKEAQVKAGTLSQAEYDRWLAGQEFIGKQWKDKAASIAETLKKANEQANALVEGEKRAVFGENATFQAYQLEHDAGVDLSFTPYDSATVSRLIKDEPELLPRKVVNGKKDIAWNKRGISNAVTQGIIQGESVDEIAKRIAKQTSSSNMKAMKRYARTAMTGAQNAGRMEALHNAQDMGIKVKKRWIAVKDSRTRDAHQELDGQIRDVDEPFDSALGKIMCPGDMHAAAGNIWNCRCALGYEYTDYPTQYAQERVYAEYVDDNGKYHRESYEMSSISYSDWKRVKDSNNQRALEAWRNRRIPAGESKVLTNIDSKINELKKQRDSIDFSKAKDTLDYAKLATKSTDIDYELQELYEKRAAQTYADDDVMKIKKHIVGEHTAADDIQAVNPKLRDEIEYQTNCQRCVPAYEMRRRGYDVVAKGNDKGASNALGGGNWKNVFQNANWIKCKKGSGLYEMTRHLESWGDGARAEVYVVWKDESAHVFIGENVAGKAVFRDPQSGEVIKMPFSARVRSGETQICRIDNLKPSNLINECCEVRK